MGGAAPNAITQMNEARSKAFVVQPHVRARRDARNVTMVANNATADKLTNNVVGTVLAAGIGLTLVANDNTAKMHQAQNQQAA